MFIHIFFCCRCTFDLWVTSLHSVLGLLPCLVNLGSWSVHVHPCSMCLIRTPFRWGERMGMIAEWDSACQGSPRPMGRCPVSECLQGVTRVAGSATSLLFPLQLFWVEGTQSAQLSSAPFTILSEQSSSLAGKSSGEQALWDLLTSRDTHHDCLPS